MLRTGVTCSGILRRNFDNGNESEDKLRLGAVLKLGTPQNGSDYFKGMVKGMRLFNHRLDTTTFSTERNVQIAR